MTKKDMIALMSAILCQGMDQWPNQSKHIAEDAVDSAMVLYNYAEKMLQIEQEI